MSYIICLRRGLTKYKYSERKTPYFSEVIEKPDKIIIFQCEFHTTIEDINNINWIAEPNLLKNVDAPFTVVEVQKDNKDIHFATSKYGTVQMFYFYNKGEFILSDNFWEIVNEVNGGNLGYEDLDVESTKEFFCVGYPLFDGTYIKNLRFVNSGYYGRYEGTSGELVLNRYHDLIIKESNQTLEEATEKLNESLQEGMQRIYDEVGDVKYSMGLSGGLDSRLIPHYAKENMKLSSYILGEKYPRKLFVSRDHRNSRELARIFDLEHEECKWSPEVFKDTMYHDVKNAPLLNQQFFKGRSDIRFDVLLNGGSGYWIGSSLPANLQELDEDKLAFEMHRLFRFVSPQNEHLRVLNAGLRIMFGKEIKSKKEIPWVNIFLDKKADQNCIEKIRKFIKGQKNNGKDNLSIFMDWFDFYGSRNMFGGYESLNGRVRAFSIYNPHVVNTVIHWKHDFFQDRMCLKKLILKYVPEVSKVKEQKYEGRIGSNSSFMRKFFNGFLFWLFGNGNDIVGIKFKYVEKEFYERMTNDCKWFYSIFDVRENIDEMMKFKGKEFLANIWKHKIVIDYLETGEYKKFIEKGEIKIL